MNNPVNPTPTPAEAAAEEINKLIFGKVAEAFGEHLPEDSSDITDIITRHFAPVIAALECRLGQAEAQVKREQEDARTSRVQLAAANARADAAEIDCNQHKSNHATVSKWFDELTQDRDKLAKELAAERERIKAIECIDKVLTRKRKETETQLTTEREANARLRTALADIVEMGQLQPGYHLDAAKAALATTTSPAPAKEKAL